MIRMVTNFDSQLYLPEEIIQPMGKMVQSLVMIQQGSCNLYGFYDTRGET